jgi:hypothetical protein
LIVGTIMLGAVATAAGADASVVATGATGYRSAAITVAGARTAGLSDRLQLVENTIRAGASVSGTLVLTNHESRTLRLAEGCHGRPLFSVVLTSAKVSQSGSLPLPACPDLVVRPGVHRFHFILRASFESCVQSGASGTGVRCAEPGNTLPPLPPGRYRTSVTSATPIPRPPGVVVTVNAAG